MGEPLIGGTVSVTIITVFYLNSKEFWPAKDSGHVYEEIITKVSVQYSTLLVHDLEESVRFYRDVLGMKEGYHVGLPSGTGITIMESEGGPAWS